MFSKHKANKTMIPKKPDGKTPAPSRLSLAARMLGGAVRATLPVSSHEEPWRNKKVKGNKRFKK
jgi:hypothetical protein